MAVITKRKAVAALIVFAVYGLATKIGALLYDGGKTAPAVIFPAAGVAIAALFLEGYSMWVPIAAASLLNSSFSATPVPTAIGIVIGSVLQGTAGAYLLRRFRFDPKIWRLMDMALLMGVALVATLVLPTVNLITALITHTAIPGTLGAKWSALWLGGILSTMLLTPLIVSWSSYPRMNVNRRFFFEAAPVFLALAIISFTVFWTPYGAPGGVSLVYAMLVPLFWIALRFGNREMVGALLLTTIVSLTGLLFGAVKVPAEQLGARLLQTEVFSIVLGAIFFIVSAISEERRSTERNIRTYVVQLEQALDKIRSADRAKSEFIAVLAHELRNPLAPALTSLEFLELQEFSTPEKEAAALQAKHNIKNMSKLLDDLLDISRVDQGKVQLDRQQVNVSEIVSRAVENTRGLIEARRHTLILAVPRDLPFVYADPLRMEQVIMNLLNNAAKYTDPGGQIQVACTAKDGFMRIQVRDTGIGIDPKALPYIFDMFHQADPSERPADTAAGLGIGLGLVKKMVELHGGSVTASSSGLGHGSEFTVSIPLAPKASAPIESKEEPATPVDTMNARKKVLIVDDNEAAANALVKLFDRLGHESRAAYNAFAGMEEALKFRPDLILLDIGLPEISGYEVAERLRTQPEFRDTVIVAVSGYGQDEDRRRSKAAGFDHHLVKPVDLETWRELLKKV